MINSQCKKNEFSVLKVISAENGEYEIKWGYEPVIERVTKLNDKTGEYEFTGEVKDTDYCMFAMEYFNTKPNVQHINKLMDSSDKCASMKELKTISDFLGLDDVQTLKWMRERMKKNIMKYDKSKAVENFTINGIDVWLKKDERTGLLLRFQSEKAKGKTETTLWKNGMSFTLKIDNAINMLYALEVYASETYDKTAEHYAESEKLNSLEGFIAYDETRKTGYPAQLAF